MSLGPLGLTELQWTLVGAGGAAVALVWGYNLWQEYRQRQLAQKIFRSEQEDALLPETAPANPTSNGGSIGEMERIEPSFPELEEAAEIPELADSGEVPQVEPQAELADRLIDCVVLIEADEQVAAPLLWAAQRKLLGKLESRLHWSGWDDDSGKWRAIHAHDATSYRRLCVALQLADRSGAISEADLMSFLEGVGQLAESFLVRAAIPAIADVLAHARALDEFCASVDWRIGLNIVARDGSPIPASRLIDLATETDLWLKDDGLFHAEDGGGQTIFTLAQLGGLPFADRGLSALSLPGVSLTIDVPRVSDGKQALDRLLELSERLTQAFNGSLVDDQRNEISAEVLDTIRNKIDEFQQKMAAHEIPAGSRRALRLYD